MHDQNANKQRQKFNTTHKYSKKHFSTKNFFFILLQLTHFAIKKHNTIDLSFNTFSYNNNAYLFKP